MHKTYLLIKCIVRCLNSAEEPSKRYNPEVSDLIICCFSKKVRKSFLIWDGENPWVEQKEWSGHR